MKDLLKPINVKALKDEVVSMIEELILRLVLDNDLAVCKNIFKNFEQPEQ